MEFLAIISLVLSIIAMTRASGAQSKISALAKELEALKGGSAEGRIASTAQQQMHAPVQAVAHPHVHPAVARMNGTEATPAKLEEESAFVTWLKEDWLMKLGGILVFMGVMFFLSIAITAMGPQGKVITGYLIGLSLMGFGFKWAKKYLRPGMSINLTGAIITIFTTYVARTPDFDLFSPVVASALIFAISAFIAYSAYVFNIAAVAHVGLVVAGLVPVLAQSGTENWVGLFSYLAVIVAGTVWLVSITKWRTLILLSQIIVTFYSAVALDAYSSRSLPELALFAFGFGALFLGSSVVGIIKSKGETVVVDAWIALLNVAFSLLWIFEKVADHNQGPALIALALVYVTAFYFVFQVTQKTASFLVYAGTSAVLLMVATALMVDSDEILAMLLLLESVALTYGTYRLSGGNINLTKITAITTIYPAFLALEALSKIRSYTYGDYYDYGYQRAPSLVNEFSVENFSIVVLAIALFGALAYAFRKSLTDLSKLYTAAAVLLATAGLWETLHALLSAGPAAFISLLVYTVVGLAILWKGYTTPDETTIKVGRFVLGAVALRIIFVDAWSFDDALIGVFICIVMGVLLLSSTVLSKKLRKNIETTHNDQV